MYSCKKDNYDPSIVVKLAKNIFTYCSDYTLIYNPDTYIGNE